MARHLSVCVVISLCAANFGFSQTKTLAPSDNPDNKRIERLVAQVRNIVFHNATLKDVVSYLESSGIPTYVDERALEDVGLAADTPVSFRRGSIRLSDGLYLLLRPLDLIWTIRHGRLVITTPEEEEDQLTTCVYDVRNLVELVPVPLWNGGFETRTAYQYDFDTLLNLITTTVAPDTWDEMGGAGSVEPYWTRRMRVIVVSQTYEIHQRIEALLGKLAQHGGVSPLPPSPTYILPKKSRTFGGWSAAQPTRGTSSLRSSQLRSSGGMF